MLQCGPLLSILLLYSRVISIGPGQSSLVGWSEEYVHLYCGIKSENDRDANVPGNELLPVLVTYTPGC